VHELASQTVGAVHVSVVLLAGLGLVLGWDMLLLEEFIVPMGKGTVVPELALPGQFPVSADL
jgi:hypothetical protein